MSKFGELIDSKVPVLFSFYTDWDEPSKNTNNVLKDVATSVGDQGKVIKIDVEKNQQLAEALKIKTLPTLILYNGGEMVWRKRGEENANTLIALMQNYAKEAPEN